MAAKRNQSPVRGIPRSRTTGPAVSVIVPLHRDGPIFRASLDRLLSLHTNVSFEVIVVSDREVESLPKQAHFVRTGSSTDTSPAEKRDAAMLVAGGGILAFIDDDAFPADDWLDKAVALLSNPLIAGVGGPGLTPPGSPWRERIGGAVYESPLGSGPLRYRFVPVGSGHDCDDLPAYNLFIRREALDAVGGWKSTFYGGEDTKLCIELVNAGFRLRYEPSILVFHHRRPVFGAHMRQIGNVGRHRGYFVRRHPETSRRMEYFLPAVANLGSIPLVIWLAREVRSRPKLTVAALGGVWALLAATEFKKLGPHAVVFPASLVCHHLSYGASFLRGLLWTRDLAR